MAGCPLFAHVRKSNPRNGLDSYVHVTNVVAKYSHAHISTKGDPP